MSVTRRGKSLLAAILLAVSGIVSIPDLAEAAGPCKVTGYTLHARLRLAERDYSKAEIEKSVKVNCSKGKWQPAPKRTWLYPAQGCSGLPTVVLNPQGEVVTFYPPSGFDGGGGCGGGGGSSWRSVPVPVAD